MASRGPEMVSRVGDGDVQAALEAVNGSRHEAAPDGAADGGAQGTDAA